VDHPRFLLALGSSPTHPASDEDPTKPKRKCSIPASDSDQALNLLIFTLHSLSKKPSNLLSLLVAGLLSRLSVLFGAPLFLCFLLLFALI